MAEQQGGLAGPAAEEGLHWDEESAHLLDALRVTSPTTADNVPGRQHLLDAYCDALEGREPGDDGPGS